MTMADERMTDTDELELLFAAARDAAPVPSDGLLARVLADAEAEQARPAPALIRPEGGLLARAMRQIGGWPALAGLATATLAGVWIGYAQPAGLDGLTDTVWQGDAAGYDLVEMIPSLDGYLTEGGV
ncbi:dihydroorotate dehydrogenase [Actibacterium sp. XHP0104]|uniref:dihydroorotate dehydrogenase n=1 Tax=Actibacterium sp. XHP0104 TaxID=2984335 RepID=UPI0021E8DF16|nr:dihydroorotate dehydrogenase [Actibacterium sp. XHP0104]MCV2881393.1 dihydroorotate dehydrogenase [Actibacterium sp. XHP0104]